ncbi:MAG: hypothetical protein IJ282_09320 [Lachnospiraceae bacterium]|nr:hypothetical protein [Lachnospiraceae bacterium]
MRNKFLSTLFTLLVLLACWGCGEEKTVISESPYTIGSAAGCSLSVVEGSVTPESISLQITNTGQGTISIGEWYAIEISEDGVWYTLPETPQDMVDLAYPIESNQSIIKDYDWQHRYGTLTTGQYRIIIKVTMPQGNGDTTTFYFAAPFSAQ